MLSFSISYPDLIKFPYFTDTIERGDRGVKQRVTFKDNSICVLDKCYSRSIAERVLDHLVTGG
jgi:hypothetical protein